MSNFLSDVKKQADTDNIEKWIRMGERKDESPVRHDLFELMVSAGKEIPDYKAGLRVYHWLKWCTDFYKRGDTFFIDYTDKNSANWALNYIGDGVRFSQKCKNVVTMHNGKYVNSLYPPDRKKGNVKAVNI